MSEISVRVSQRSSDPVGGLRAKLLACRFSSPAQKVLSCIIHELAGPAPTGGYSEVSVLETSNSCVLPAWWIGWLLLSWLRYVPRNKMLQFARHAIWRGHTQTPGWRLCSSATTMFVVRRRAASQPAQIWLAAERQEAGVR